MRFSKTAILLGLVVIGAAAAFLFRRTGTTVEATPLAAEAPTMERRLFAAPPGSLATKLQTAPETAAEPPRRIPTVATVFVGEGANDPPQLPERYQQAFSPVGAILQPAEPSLQNPLRDELPGEGEDQPPRAIPNARPKTISHRIVDGDTLHSLAQQFLGDADRFREIYDVNREVLKDPDLLPIGRVIKIPPRDTLPEAALVPIPRGAFQRDSQ